MYRNSIWHPLTITLHHTSTSVILNEARDTGFSMKLCLAAWSLRFRTNTHVCRTMLATTGIADFYTVENFPLT